MNETEQQDAIASELGFKAGHYHCNHCNDHVPRYHESVTSGGFHSPKDGCGGKLDNPRDFIHDANAALELTALLAKEGWRCHIDNNNGTTWECWLSKAKERGYYAKSDTLAKAICESFLRVKGLYADMG